MTSPNRFLSLLPRDSFDALAPHLRTIHLESRAVLFEMGDDIERVIFPHSGIVSITLPMAGGETIEAGTVGRTGVVGGAAVLDGKKAVSQAFVQAEGQASMVSRSVLEELAGRFETLRKMLVQHEQYMYVQAQQCAGCNAIHNVQERTCRWILHTRDLLDSETLPLTQEFMATMIGVKRTSVTVVARELQRAGLISYRRGRIVIKDLEGLQDTACECYGTVKGYHDELLCGLRPNE